MVLHLIFEFYKCFTNVLRLIYNIYVKSFVGTVILPKIVIVSINKGV